MTIRVKQTIIFILLLITLSSTSFAQNSLMEKDITVEQYIYSLMKTLSIEPSDKSIEGMDRYIKEAEKRYWIDMDTPRPLNRSLEKHEMIDLAVTALREKGEVKYGTPSEIHAMVKDFKEVPYRSRIATVLGVNMGLVKLDEDGNINPFEKVSVEEASKFLMELGKAVRAYPEYDYLTENREYETEINGLVDCLLINGKYGGTTISTLTIEGFVWNEIYNLKDFGFVYDDVSVTYEKSYMSKSRVEQIGSEFTIGIYKPGPVLHNEWKNGKIDKKKLTFEIDEDMRKKRLEMAREIAKVYYPLNQIELINEYLIKHTSEKFLEDKLENMEYIIIDNMLYRITHSFDTFWINGLEVKSAPKDDVKSARVIRHEKK